MAGGQLAASCAVVSGYDDPSDDTTVSAVPNALILFNPALSFDIPKIREAAGAAEIEKLRTILDCIWVSFALKIIISVKSLLHWL